MEEKREIGKNCGTCDYANEKQMEKVAPSIFRLMIIMTEQKKKFALSRFKI